MEQKHFSDLYRFFPGNCAGEHCKICVEQCPKQCIDVAGGSLVFNEGCVHCDKCMRCCPNEAIDKIRVKVPGSMALIFIAGNTEENQLKKLKGNFLSEITVLPRRILDGETQTLLESHCQKLGLRFSRNSEDRPLSLQDILDKNKKTALVVKTDARPINVSLFNNLIEGHHEKKVEYSKITEKGLFLPAEIISRRLLEEMASQPGPTKSISQLVRRKYMFRHETFAVGNILPLTAEPPRYATLVIGSKCNSRCTICAYHSNDKILPYWKNAQIDFDSFKIIVDKLCEGKVRQINICADGEVLLHHDFFKMVKYIKSRGAEATALSNGILIDKYLDQLTHSGLDIFSISFDSGEKEQFEMIRKFTKFDDVVSNLKKLVAANKACGNTMSVQAYMVLMKINYKSLRPFLDLANDIGFDSVSFNTINPIGTNAITQRENMIFETDNEIIESVREDIHYGRSLGLKLFPPLFYSRKTRRTYCEAFWTNIMVGQSSNYYSHDESKFNVNFGCPVINTQYAAFGDNVGSLKDHTFEEIWNGEKLKLLRREIQRSPQYHCHHNCTRL